jgi:hypothetical protein
MITAADADFHPRDPSIMNWTETMFMIFTVPEAGILGNLYVLARPNLGVATSSVMVQQGFCRQPYEIDFSDPQVHVACPESFTRYTLATGLGVEVTRPPLDYHVQYAASSGACRLDLSFTALMPAFDMHDPEQNPLFVEGDDWAEPHDASTAAGKGHFDLLGRVTGELELRGRKYQVDCVDGMDHSWGPRSEESAGTGSRAASWMHVSFGEDFGMHLATALDIRNGEVVYDGLRFGYVMEDGEVFGLVEANVHTTRVDMLGVSNHIQAKDVRGREYEFFGTAVAAAPWYSFNPCCASFQSLYRYQHDGRVGYNEGADIFGLNFLGERLSRHGGRPSATAEPVEVMS